ncbi:hypothetical protein K502DRAFT_340215 [Neoconidiobolus thromboides FSU 785]|nr:hypothetical protein K502DRAFT_340215 [Neoconidiobolus thromboides FSU 785]
MFHVRNFNFQGTACNKRKVKQHILNFDEDFEHFFDTIQLLEKRNKKKKEKDGDEFSNYLKKRKTISNEDLDTFLDSSKKVKGSSELREEMRNDGSTTKIETDVLIRKETDLLEALRYYL